MKSLLRSPRVQAALARLLGGYLWVSLRTTRWTLDGMEHLAPFLAGKPAIFGFWHEHLPLIPALVITGRRIAGSHMLPVHALISQHRDGRMIGAVVRRFGIEPVYGSSTRGGSASLRQLIRLLRDGAMIGITPDGPQGPRREAADGIANLAALANVPILPCAAQTTHRITLSSWDRMGVPLPFGRGVLVCGPPVIVPREDWRGAMPLITSAMNQASGRAALLTGQPVA